MPWIIVTYSGLSVVDGILGTEIYSISYIDQVIGAKGLELNVFSYLWEGICAITLEDSGTMKAAMIFAIGYLILAIVLLIFFSLLACCYRIDFRSEYGIFINLIPL